MQDIKTCSKCGQSKIVSEFGQYKPGHYRKQCKKCVIEYRREYNEKNREHVAKIQHEHYKKNYEKNREHRIKYHKKYRETIIGRCVDLANGAKTRSRAKNLEYNINADIIYIMMITQKNKCAKTGLKFDLKSSENTHRNPYAPSLDRKDNSKGYSVENTQIVCNMYNFGKGEATEKQFSEMCLALVKREGLITC